MKINFGDDFGSVITKMADGNIGAHTVLIELLSDGFKKRKDEYIALLPILILDKLNLYGSDIWRLYKDVCKKNLQEMLLLLDDYHNKKYSREEIIKKLNPDADNL